VNDVLAERIRRKMETLSDEQAYQVLDYVEFLESKYAQRAAGAPAFQRWPRRSRTRSAPAVCRSTSSAHDGHGGKAGKFLEGLAAAGKAAVEEAKKKPVEESKPGQ